MSGHHLPSLPLPHGISEAHVQTDDLTYHVLHAGASPHASRHLQKPLLLLLHGFPELAFSWRKVMPALASEGYHVVAYDQRGYGRTTGWDTRAFEQVDLGQFTMSRVVTDAVRLVNALGYKEVECVLGHDFGAVAASMCALTRGDVFKSVVLMSHPFKGTPSFPFDTVKHPQPASDQKDVRKDLASLEPPRKHYKWYYATAPANAEMTEPKAQLAEFLRGYFHLKSADWEGNKPVPLKEWSAKELSKLPYYYVMPMQSGMREAVAQDMKSEDPKAVASKSARWLPDSDLQVYAEELARNGFQGGLNWYRVQTDSRGAREVELFAGRKIDVPALFISGRSDWGMYQQPGALESMEKECSKFKGSKIVDGAGHWVQQEQPQEVVKLVLDFLREVKVERVTV
ncbi:MAG: hypothetical protein M1818_007383 [Claussenomyces sp. TS43310]|nr:MAG: hypothetical protein M1818_007383 [Claussenomyces sp. TS43310]